MPISRNAISFRYGNNSRQTVNLRALRYFVAIADAGSLTAAAAVVSIAQPALSRQLRELEADLGLQLLHRTPRGIRLTSAGVTLYESARRMLDEAARVRQLLAGQDHAEQASVTLGASPTLSRVLLPGVFERCHHGLSGVRLVVREAFTPVLLDGLERGLIDIAIVTNPEPGRALALYPLLGEPFALITNSDWGLDPVVSLAQLAAIPLVMTNLHRRLVEQQLAPLGARLNLQAEIDSVDTIRELVLQGNWATVLPVSVFNEPHSARTVRLSEISGVQLSRLLVLATRIERTEQPHLWAMGGLVRAECDRLAAAGIFGFAPPPPQTGVAGKGGDPEKRAGAKA
jgi:LysR family nitrogen assimilation transcriptional regulator